MSDQEIQLSDGAATTGWEPELGGNLSQRTFGAEPRLGGRERGALMIVGKIYRQFVESNNWSRAAIAEGVKELLELDSDDLVEMLGLLGRVSLHEGLEELEVGTGYLCSGIAERLLQGVAIGSNNPRIKVAAIQQLDCGCRQGHAGSLWHDVLIGDIGEALFQRGRLIVKDREVLLAMVDLIAGFVQAEIRWEDSWRNKVRLLERMRQVQDRQVQSSIDRLLSQAYRIEATLGGGGDE